MLASKVALHDVDDVEGFVQATINRFQQPTAARGRVELSADERDDLVAEGMRLMYVLAKAFKSRSIVHDGPSRFSGYAAMYLPRKLGDVWHRNHPEHMLVTQPNGKRRWEYADKGVSLDALAAEDPDNHPVMATQDEVDVEGRLRAALKQRADERVEQVVAVGMILASGGTPSDAAAALGIASADARDLVKDIQAVAHRLQGAGD